MKKILIVEDHPVFAEVTKYLLLKMDASLEIIITLSAETAIETFKTKKPWYRIFMDIDIPGAYGLTLARRLQKLGVAEITTIVTGFGNQQWSAEAQKMGMLGYISKVASYAEYIASLNSVLDGIRAFSNAEQSVDDVPQLTRRQLDLLCLLHRGLTTREIAKQLAVTEGHVNNVCQTLKTALRAKSRSHAISRAVELGHINVHDCQKILH